MRDIVLFFALATSMALCVAVVVLLDGLRSSGARAEEQSAYGQNAGYEYTIEVADPAAQRQLDDAGLTKVTTAVGAVESPIGRASVVLITSLDPDVARAYGTTSGSNTISDEPALAMSEAAARLLDVSVGDRVGLSGPGQPQQRSVTRIFSIPNDPDTAVVVATVTEEVPGSSRWLLSASDLEKPSIESLLDDESLDGSMRSSAGLAAERTDVLEAGRFSALKYVVPFGLVLTLAAWTAVAVLARARMLRHSGALVALGLTPGEARGVLRRASSTAAIVGMLLGAAVGVLVIVVLYAALGRLIDQGWQTGATSLGRVGWYLVACTAGALLISELAIRDAPGRPRRAGLRPAWRIGLGATGLLGAIVAYALADSPSVNPYLAALSCGLLIVVAATTVSQIGTDLYARFGPRHLVVAAQRATPSAWVAALVASAITFAGSFLGANAHSELVYGRSTYTPPQPPSSIAVEQADAPTVDLLTQTWEQSRDTKPWLFPLPDESTTQVRVSTPAYVECARASLGELQECPEPNTFVNPNVVAVGAVDYPGWVPGQDTLRADRELISDGRVGLIATAPDGTVLDTWVVPAEPDDSIGNQLPGAIISSGSPLAAEIGLTAGPYSRVLLDGTALSMEELDRVAAMLSAVVPAADIAVERGFDDGGLGVFIAFVTIGSAALASVLLIVFGLGLVDTSTPFRLALVSLAPTARTRSRVATVMLSDILATLIAVPVALLVTAPLWTDLNDWVAWIVFLPLVAALSSWAFVLARLTGEPKQ